MLLFNGCRVSLIDSGDPPYLPKVGTSSGNACLTVLSNHIRAVATAAPTLPVGKMRLRSVHVGANERKVGVLVERIIEPADPPRMQFVWSGSGPSYRVDVSRGILTRAVRDKIDKQYSKPREGQFYLLAYSVDTLLLEDDPDFREARALLDQATHPFDEVWYFFPYAEKTLGHLVRVWPTQNAA